MPIIGLTGGIASGKSTAARFAKDLGATVIDADHLGHQAYGQETLGYESVLAEFGSGILAPDGSIDRKSLGTIVFKNSDALRKLTDIVWPIIRDKAAERIAEIKSQNPNAVVVLEAAVLIEAGLMDLCDEVWVVLAEEETVIQRAVQRDGVNRAFVKSRISSQLGNAVRSSYASVLIHNDGSLECLNSQIKREIERFGCHGDTRA